MGCRSRRPPRFSRIRSRWLFEDAVDPGRTLLIGVSDRQRILFSVYTEIDDTIRIISARRATSHERRHYEEDT
jgi:uncharacterized DUF497 family protein